MASVRGYKHQPHSLGSERLVGHAIECLSVEIVRFGSETDVARSITHVCFVATSELRGFCRHLLSARQGVQLHRTSSILIPDGYGPLLVAYLSVM